MESERKYPTNDKDYKLYEEIGEGVSAKVYRALCKPLNEMVAIKVLDLERCNSDLDGIRREVQTMNLIDHPKRIESILLFHCWLPPLGRDALYGRGILPPYNEICFSGRPVHDAAKDT